MVSKFTRQAPITKRKVKKARDLGAVLLIFMGAILGIVLLGSLADSENKATSTITITNDTVTLPSSVGGTSELTGRDHISTTAIVNSTGSDISGNVTISDGLGSDGTKTVILTLDGLTIDSIEINGTSANVSYVANPDGYVSGAGGTFLTLVILFGALGVLVFVIVILLKRGSLDFLIRRF